MDALGCSTCWLTNHAHKVPSRDGRPVFPDHAVNDTRRARVRRHVLDQRKIDTRIMGARTQQGRWTRTTETEGRSIHGHPSERALRSADALLSGLKMAITPGFSSGTPGCTPCVAGTAPHPNAPQRCGSEPSTSDRHPLRTCHRSASGHLTPICGRRPVGTALLSTNVSNSAVAPTR